jgi:hypothetical protein
MQPSPIAETSGPALPSLRRSVITVPLIDLSGG